jgi:hypothetical protein
MHGHHEGGQTMHQVDRRAARHRGLLQSARVIAADIRVTRD